MVQIIHCAIRTKGWRWFKTIALYEVTLGVVNNHTARLIEGARVSPKFKTKEDLKDWVLKTINVIAYDKEWGIYTAEFPIAGMDWFANIDD